MQWKWQFKQQELLEYVVLPFFWCLRTLHKMENDHTIPDVMDVKQHFIPTEKRFFIISVKVKLLSKIQQRT